MKDLMEGLWNLIVATFQIRPWDLTPLVIGSATIQAASVAAQTPGSSNSKFAKGSSIIYSLCP